MNSNNIRLVPTGLFTDAAEEIISSVIDQWSDGIWENSSSKEKYWKFANCHRAANGEVMIAIDNVPSSYEKWRCFSAGKFVYNGFYSLPDSQIRDIFGKTARRIVQIEFSDDKGKVKPHSWVKDNVAELQYMGGHKTNVTVSMVYQFWMIMCGGAQPKASGDKLDIVGKPLSDEEAKAAQAKIDEYKACREQVNANIKKLEEDYKAQVKALEKAKNDKRRDLWVSLQEKAKELGIDPCRV